MVETRSASTALNKHKCLTQFFKWLVLDEEAIHRSPMQRVRPPITPEKLIPILTLDETRKLLAACNTKSFVDLRDQAIIRLFYNTGGRLSEIANLHIDDVDLHGETVRFHGKGAKDRRVRIGPKTGRAISRYLRARAGRRGADLPHLWLAERGCRPLAANGIKIRLRTLGAAAGVAHVHAHRCATASPTNGNSPAATPATSCCSSAGAPTTCHATTAPAPPPNARNRPRPGSRSESAHRETCV